MNLISNHHILVFQTSNNPCDWNKGMQKVLPNNPHLDVTTANEQFHDEIANVYDDHNKGVFNEKNQAHIISVLKSLKDEENSGILLDVGCGTGNILKNAKPHFKEIYGIDISSKMMEYAKQFTSNIVKHDINTPFPFNKNNFDVITCYSLLHHLYDPGVCLKNVYDSLKEGGYLYSDHDPNFFFVKRFNWWKKIRKVFLNKELSKSVDTRVDELEAKAEYHNTFSPGLNPEKLVKILYGIGFKEVKLVYRFPPTPDKFTKCLIFLNKLAPSKTYKCYFSIIARK